MELTGKEIYERKKRLRAERLLRQEENAAQRQAKEDEGEFLIASLAASFERIADALEDLAKKP